jgi:hypothetical protein
MKAVVLALTVFPLLPLSAQVGHNPGSSPYHDVRRGLMIRLAAGYFGGTRGKVPVGPSQGPTGGVRLEYLAGNVLTITGGLAYARTDAFYVTAYDTVPRQVGPLNSHLVLADMGLQVSLTGAKTVYGVQPYVGANLGIVFGSAFTADTSGYIFGTKFSFGPEAGLRWFPARRLSFEASGRLVYYKMQYPLSYKLYVLPVNAKLSESTVHPWATFGVAWTF